MAIPTIPLKVPGVALVAAAALTLTPAVVAPAITAPSVQMHVEDIALAGIGQDIYYAITPWVQYAVGGVSYLINFIPLVGGLAAAQININYFQAVQPGTEATVNYLAALVQDPLDFLPTTAAFGSTVFDIGYNWVSAQLMFVGLQPLTPLPQGSAAVRPGAVTRTPAPAAAETPTPIRPPRSDSPATVGDSLGVVRESLRGGHFGTPRPRAAAAAAQHRPAAEDQAAAPRSPKATAHR